MLDSFDPRTCKVALLSGGTSGEREISIASGKGAMAALLEAGFEVESFDPAQKEDLKALIDGHFDVAFLCLHGRKGEDGAIQGFLELIDLPYIGSGIWASSLAIDKNQSKKFYCREGIPTPDSMVLGVDDSCSAADIVSRLGCDCVLKPATEGSSLGVFITHSENEIEEALESVFKYDSQVLVEKYIQGTELTVAVLGNEEPFALPIIEIIPQSDSYDFDSKYAPGGSQHICPARLSDSVASEVKELAVRAHKALGCSGVSRSDFILDEDGVSWVLETNTIPGMTGTSLLPDAAKAVGISFPELCVMLVKYALQKNDK